VIRRLLPLGVALGLGFAGLGALLWVLHGTFQDERAAALAESAARRAALEQYARAGLAQSLALRLQLEGPRLAAAAADPLLPANDLLLWEGGRQVLPRLAHPAPHSAARALFEALVSEAPVASEEEGPWQDRLTLRTALLEALVADDRAAVAQGFRAILAALSQYVLPAEQDVPYVLAILEVFVKKGQPDPRLLRMVLHDGVPDGRGGVVESVQRRLLRRREAFTREDFTFLAAKIQALGQPAGVPDHDFQARVAEVGTPVPLVGDSPALLAGGWYAVPDAGGARGLRVPEGPLLQGLTQEMRARGLLGEGDRVTAGAALVGPVQALDLKVQSPAWSQAVADADQAFGQKTLLLVLCALLALAIVALALLGQRRKQRYLALQNDFVQAVSHELRTPLASIRLMAETLERRLKEEPKARDYPARIVGAVDGLALMVENILSFNRLDRGRWVARRERLALADVLAKARDKVVPHAAKPLIWLEKGDLDLTLSADPELMELLLVNLARNAVQYCDRPEAQVTFTATRGGGTGRLRSRAGGDERAGLRLEVADNGRGMSPAVARQVFTPFYRAPESAGTRGSGLGLALCQRIVALHGGRMQVGATSPEGTVFIIEFPQEILA